MPQEVFFDKILLRNIFRNSCGFNFMVNWQHNMPVGSHFVRVPTSISWYKNISLIVSILFFSSA